MNSTPTPDPTTSPSASPSVKPKHSRRWWGGLLLIGLGGAFLAQGMGFSVLPQNWWAGFILLAALSSFWRAWLTFQDAKRITSAVKGQIMGGLNAGAVAVIFLFGLDWAKAWPVFLILAGISALIYPREKRI